MDAHRVRYATLASGSAGNSAVVDVDGRFTLIDFGLGPRQISQRLRVLGITWPKIEAVVLTHTHGDHWREPTISHFLQHRLPLYAHPRHIAELRGRSEGVSSLDRSGLLRTFADREAFALGRSMQATPFEVSHDSLPTFGFRFDVAGDPAARIVHAADLGSWDAKVRREFVGASVIGLEFNHDVAMERNCSRPAVLIDRVLGDYGHLSNEQAVRMLHEIISESESPPRHLVQLHLSQQCNRPELARAAVKPIAARFPITVHTAAQDRPLSWIDATPRRVWKQLALPGMDAIGLE